MESAVEHSRLRQRFSIASAAYHCEVGPVTFQIGIIASDGIILASDMLQATTGFGSEMTTALVEKIVVVAPKKLAYCCAGDSLAMAAAELIADTIELGTDLRSFFLRCVDETVKSHAASHKSWNGGCILVVLAHQAPELWRIDFTARSDIPPTANRIMAGFLTTGDYNYARFFLELYLTQHPHPKPKIDQVILLASHTILNAGMLNMKQVAGLEMVLCRAGVIERVKEDRIKELTDLSSKLDKKIKRSLRPASTVPVP